MGNALIYSTYLGGSGDDFGQGIAVDSSGNAYIAGYTTSQNYPHTTGVCHFQAVAGGVYDAMVTKLGATGNLVYSTYLGGNSYDYGFAEVAVDSAAGNAYVTGGTSSTNFPVVNSLQASLAGQSNVFVAQINPAGTALLFSTLRGGSGLDMGFGIVLDSLSGADVTGSTTSYDFPVSSGASQPAYSVTAKASAFVFRLNFQTTVAAQTITFARAQRYRQALERYRLRSARRRAPVCR